MRRLEIGYGYLMRRDFSNGGGHVVYLTDQPDPPYYHNATNFDNDLLDKIDALSHGKEACRVRLVVEIEDGETATVRV